MVVADDSADSTKEDQGLILELLDTAYAFSRQDNSKKSDVDDALWQQVELTFGAKASAIQAMSFHSIAGICQAGGRQPLGGSPSAQASVHTEAVHYPKCHLYILSCSLAAILPAHTAALKHPNIHSLCVG